MGYIISFLLGVGGGVLTGFILRIWRKYNVRLLASMNTFWSLTSSTVITFWLSFVLNKGKFSIDHILNATLSGGIAIAASG